mgnify:CR=1 FL=1
MKGKKILAALGFFSIAGVAGGCSQPALYTLSDRNRPTLSDDGILQCFRCLEYAIHRALAAGETKPGG